MKIHEKDPASGLLPVSPPSPTKRRRPSVKRRQEEENGEEPPAKKVCTRTNTHYTHTTVHEYMMMSLGVCVCCQVVEDAVAEESSAAVHGGEEELLPCPICFKTCSSRLELDAHMDTHPDTALRYTHTSFPRIPCMTNKVSVDTWSILLLQYDVFPSLPESG